jgi:hypothetical protein
VWIRFRAEARRRWVAWCALAALVGVTGGAVLALLMGATRADAAYARFLARARPFDVAVQGNNELPFDTIRRLPQVAQAAMIGFALLDFPGLDAGSDEEAIEPLVPADGVMFERISLPKVLDGRRPDSRDPHEVAITPTVSEVYGLEVGDTITVQGFTYAQLEQYFGGEPVAAAGPVIRLRVVGIEVAPGEFVESGNDMAMHPTVAFYERYRDEVAIIHGVALRLHGGSRDVPAFKARVERLLGGAAPNFITQEEDAADVRRSIHLQAVALRLFAAAAALAALFIVGQAIARQAALDDADRPVLLALGMDRRGLLSLAGLRALSVGALASIVAVVTALAASPFVLFGLARRAEPDTGVSVDALALAVGAVAVLACTLLVAAIPALRAARVGAGRAAAAPTARPGRSADQLARLGAPPPVVAGVRMAFETGGGAGALPTRAALVGTTATVGAIMMALVFGASLQHLFSTPRLYGWEWDAVYGNPYLPDLAEAVLPVLERSEEVGAVSVVTFGQVEVDGVRTQAMAFEPVQGSVGPPIVSGEAPDQPDEVAIGASVLDDIGRSVGDVVVVRAGPNDRRMRVVGRAVFARLGQYDVSGLGDGALVTAEGMRSLQPDVPRNLFAVRFRAGLPTEETAQAIATRGVELNVLPTPPRDVADFGQVDAMPSVLVALLALIGAATLAHTLATLVRRRRQELAVLKTLGFVRGQVRQAAAWQSVTIAAVALAIGLPLGAAAGQLLWRTFANGLGVVPEPVVPGAPVLILVPAAFVVTLLVAALPGRAAARIPVYLGLRAE